MFTSGVGSVQLVNVVGHVTRLILVELEKGEVSKGRPARRRVREL